MPLYQRPRLTPLLPLDPESPRPPRIVQRSALLLGGKTQLARLVNCNNQTVSDWMKRGYGIEVVSKIYFVLGEHIKELQEHRDEMEVAMLKAVAKRGYRFPPDGVWTKMPDGSVR